MLSRSLQQLPVNRLSSETVRGKAICGALRHPYQWGAGGSPCRCEGPKTAEVAATNDRLSGEAVSRVAS
jgi:hypothetical protein